MKKLWELNVSWNDVLDVTVQFFPSPSVRSNTFFFFFQFVISKLETTFQNNRETMQMIHTEIPRAKGHFSNDFIT